MLCILSVTAVNATNFPSAFESSSFNFVISFFRRDTSASVFESSNVKRLKVISFLTTAFEINVESDVLSRSRAEGPIVLSRFVFIRSEEAEERRR